jgi:hypothetical protein
MAFKRQTLRKRIFHAPFAKEAKEAQAMYRSVIEYAEDVAYLIGDIGFIIGSIFFFAKFYDDTGLAGSWMFIIISVINVALGMHDLYETVHARSLGLLELERSEVLECILNVLSAVFFTVGTFIELPKFDSDNFQFADLFAIFGSASLVVSSYFNAVGMAADKSESLISRICLGCTLMGAVMFTVGATLYLPEIAAVPTAYALGTWMYVWGSVLFTISAILGIVMAYQASDTKSSI